MHVVLKNGASINGLLLNEDTFTVQIAGPDGRPSSYQRADLNDFSFLQQSLMPSYQGKLNPQELADVVAYIAALRGSGSSNENF